MGNFIGIDNGTSSAKCMIIDNKGKVLATGHVSYKTSRPQPGFAEQDPEEWWEAAVESVKDALSAAAIDPASIEGIGFTGQMHGLVMLDNRHTPVAPAIIWSDTRSAPQVERIRERFGNKWLEISGGPLSTGFLLASLLWVKEERQMIYKRISTIMAPKDYLRFKCTGQLGTDPTDAAGTGAYRNVQGTWNEDLLRQLDLDVSLFPDIMPSGSVAGRLHQAAAEQLGLPAGIPVVAGCGDLQASALGLGIVRTDELLVNVGTGGQVFQLTDSYRYDPEGRFHAMPYVDGKSFHVMGAMLAAGLSLSWAADLFLANRDDRLGREASDIDDLFDNEAGYIACKEGLFFLPYLIGERTPHMNNRLRASFIGLSESHNRHHLFRAVMEGIAFSLLQCYRTIESFTETPTQIRAGGGPFRNRYFRQLIADMFGMDVSFADQPHSTVLGAALLACHGITGKGLHDFEEERLRSVIVTNPDMERQHIYQQAYSRFIKLQPIQLYK